MFRVCFGPDHGFNLKASARENMALSNSTSLQPGRSGSPAVSIVVPIKGRIDLFRDTLASLQGQTFDDWECILVDDGSTARERSALAELIHRDQRFVLMDNPGPRRGASAARNAGFRASRGRYVIFVDSDDALAPCCLENRVQVMDEDPSLDYAAFVTWVFHAKPGDSQKVWNADPRAPHLQRFIEGDSVWHTSGPIWRRHAFEKLGGWDDRAASWQDWEFHVRATAANLRYRFIVEADSYWRATREGAMTKSSELPRKIINRARLFSRVAATLKTHPLWPELRDLMAAHYLTHAFKNRLPRQRKFCIWNRARRDGVVSGFTYWTVILLEALGWVVGRVVWKFERKLLGAADPLPGPRWKPFQPSHRVTTRENAVPAEYRSALR